MIDITHYGRTYLGFSHEDFSSHYIGTITNDSNNVFVTGFGEITLGFVNGKFRKGKYHCHAVVTDQNTPAEIVVFNKNVVGDGDWDKHGSVPVERKTLGIAFSDQDHPDSIEESLGRFPYKAKVHGNNIYVRSGHGQGTYDCYVYTEQGYDDLLGIRFPFIEDNEYF